MQSQASSSGFTVDNPYVYWRAAQEYEQSGDVDAAEIGYKAAVLAADNLPLAEYRRDFHGELAKHASIPGYESSPGVGPNELKTAYAELLTLPFAARVRLALFFSRQNKITESIQMCKSATALKVDEWLLTQEIYIDLKQQLDGCMLSLQLVSLRPHSAPTAKPKASFSHEKVRSHAYNLPDITEMWDAHIRSETRSSRSDLLVLDMEAPLALDAAAMISSMHGYLRRFIDDLEADERKRLKITISEVEGRRFRASTTLSALSVRASDTVVEVFTVPTRDVLTLSHVETDESMNLRFELQGTQWFFDGFPLYADDLRVTLRNAFKHLISQAKEFLNTNRVPQTNSTFTGLAKRVSELTEQHANLAEKIVYQQETVQNRIARDIHDSVIADILALKRSYEAKTTDDAQVLATLDEVSQKLRNICSDLAPRDLQDWGLRTVVTDLAASAAQRLKVSWNAKVASDLPDLPHQVSLHLYRILQECLNNMEKHARATDFKVEVTLDNGMLVMTVMDNGVGFDPAAKDLRKAAQGGMGLDSIRERVELIRCFYPAQLWIQSKPGAGTMTTVQINLNRT